jgi:beta-glucanase (GH16 family)
MNLYENFFFNQVIVIALFIAFTPLVACNKASVSSAPATPAPSSLSSSTVTTNQTYQMVWSDEFNGTGSVDATKWAFCPRGTAAWTKYLTASTAYASQNGSNLVLTMDNAMIPGDPVPYHAGGIQSMGKFSFTYGKVEVRAKFTQGQGSWPAIWLMPEPATAHPGGWPACGEMDIMEHINNSSVVNQSLHNSSTDNASGATMATYTPAYNTTDYNIYTLVWTPTDISFSVNNVVQYTYYKLNSGGSQQFPYDVPFYIILNQSGGAGWPGPINNANLPFSMQVDYVHVYQLK